MKITIDDKTLREVARRLFQCGTKSYAEMEDTAVETFMKEVADKKEKVGLAGSYSITGPQGTLQGGNLVANLRSARTPLERPTPSVQLSLFDDLPEEEEVRAEQARNAESRL